MAKDFDDFGGVNPNVLYDLRQTYAIRLLTPILIDIEIYREEGNFMKWFECLTERLYVNVHQKLSDKEREAYKELKNTTLKAISKENAIYRGLDKNPERRYRLKMTILDLELFLREKMEDKGLFGKGGDYDWDEI